MTEALPGAPELAGPWRARSLTYLGFWAAGTAALGTSGVFERIAGPAIAGLVALTLVVPLLVYATNAGFRGYIRSLPIRTLTTFHLWRIPAAVTFFWYGAHDLLPATFVRNAAWGDLIAGLLVPFAVMGVQTRGKYLAFHLFGLADFVLAVGTGLVFSLMNDPKMATITTMPVVMIPLFGVGVSGVTHLFALDRLLRIRGGAFGKDLAT